MTDYELLKKRMSPAPILAVGNGEGPVLTTLEEADRPKLQYL